MDNISILFKIEAFSFSNDFSSSKFKNLSILLYCSIVLVFLKKKISLLLESDWPIRKKTELSNSVIKLALLFFLSSVYIV